MLRSLRRPAPCGQSSRPAKLASAASKPLRKQVFISHTGQDEGAVNFAASLLKPAFEAAGLEVFMEPEGRGLLALEAGGCCC